MVHTGSRAFGLGFALTGWVCVPVAVRAEDPPSEQTMEEYVKACTRATASRPWSSVST